MGTGGWQRGGAVMLKTARSTVNGLKARAPVIGALMVALARGRKKATVRGRKSW